MNTETTLDHEGRSEGGEQGFHLFVMSPAVFSSQPLPAAGTVTLGRSATCTVRLDDAMASREHARLHVTPGESGPTFTIEDAGSANGTRVREVLIQPAEVVALAPGEAIMIGSTVVMVAQDRGAGLRGLRSDADGKAAVAGGTAMNRVRALAMRAAPSSINVLILGEMGVGKDVLARAIHQMSKRADKPFLRINCGGIPEALLESELFGHEKGAFTGASTSKPGLFEAANGGTVFLDEIGEMPMPMQVKLLQVLETREVRPVGGRLEGRPIDVRFISATNIDIEAAVRRGTFRGDLMYRLNTLTLAIPPLRERVDELAPLVATFLAQLGPELGRGEELTVSAEAMACLRAYSWPGNIRELKNVIERAILLCDGREIAPEHLPPDTVGSRPARTLVPLEDPEERADRQRILDALEACAGNQKRAAARLGISRTTLSARLDLYGIPRPQKGSGQSVQ